jgi:hypothetical protein
MDALAMGVLLAIIEKENKTTYEFNTTFKLITFSFGLVLALIWFLFNGKVLLSYKHSNTLFYRDSILVL